MWTANLAALELHVHQWKVGAPAADLLVLDLDPGPPATVVECCEVARLLRPVLEADGLVPLAKTSGSKGMQLYARVDGLTSEQTSAYAKGLAQRFEASHPDLVAVADDPGAAAGKVLVDWSQNSARRPPSASTRCGPASGPPSRRRSPGTRCAACTAPEDLVFTSDDVLARVAEHGDLFAPLLS